MQQNDGLSRCAHPTADKLDTIVVVPNRPVVVGDVNCWPLHEYDAEGRRISPHEVAQLSLQMQGSALHRIRPTKLGVLI